MTSEYDNIRKNANRGERLEFSVEEPKSPTCKKKK